MECTVFSITRIPYPISPCLGGFSNKVWGQRIQVTPCKVWYAAIKNINTKRGIYLERLYRIQYSIDTICTCIIFYLMFSAATLSRDRPVNVLRINLLDQPGISSRWATRGDTWFAWSRSKRGRAKLKYPVCGRSNGKDSFQFKTLSGLQWRGFLNGNSLLYSLAN